jgi:hypothetical protein
MHSGNSQLFPVVDSEQVLPSLPADDATWHWPSEISNTMEWSIQFLDPAYLADHPVLGTNPIVEDRERIMDNTTDP